MKYLLKYYGLSITLFSLFLVSWIGQSIAQWQEFSQNQIDHGQSPEMSVFMWEFSAATLENWQSEFLQLFTFVVLTTFLIHRGSHESKDGTEQMKKQLTRIENILKNHTKSK